VPERLAVVVSGGPIRNPDLVPDLESLGFDVHVVGVAARQLDWERLADGCRISRAELACRIGHARAYDMARSPGWLLVCEDDADLRCPVVESTLDLLTTLDDATPTVVSLYLGPWSVVRSIGGSPPLLEAVSPPDGAVCYFINAAARAVAGARWDTLRPADWPLWARHCRFLIVPGGAVPISGVPSRIAPDSGRHRRAARSGREALRRLGQVSGAVLLASSSRGVYGVRDWWFWEVRQRLLWRLPGLARARRSSTLRAGAEMTGVS
jgi:hypothetical protein